MKNEDDEVTYFAETDYRNKRSQFGIRADDRTRHIYVIGKTGMGKSTVLENLAVQDIQNGNGLAFVDPHGSTAETLMRYIPPERADDVLYFAPFDTDFPIGFNIMEDVGEARRFFVADGLMSVFKRVWLDAWSARMEYILKNTILALLEYPGSTLLDINRVYTEKAFRDKVVANITDMSTKKYWIEEYAKYTDRYVQEATPAIQNKVGQFAGNPLIRNIIGQAKSTFDLRDIMDNKKILIVNLSKGLVGEQNVNLLGSMLVTKIYLAAMSRQDVPMVEREKLPNFYLYVDEFQSFANESFANILSEARKYKLNLTIAHQYIEQMSDEVRAAVFGNVGTMITFRVGPYDADVLEKEFAPQFVANDLVNLSRFQIYLKLMINGVSSKPFSAMTAPPIPEPIEDSVELVKARSRELYGRPRMKVEEEIESRSSLEQHEHEDEEARKFEERRQKRIAEGRPLPTDLEAAAAAANIKDSDSFKKNDFNNKKDFASNKKPSYPSSKEEGSQSTGSSSSDKKDNAYTSSRSSSNGRTASSSLKVAITPSNFDKKSASSGKDFANKEISPRDFKKDLKNIAPPIDDEREDNESQEESEFKKPHSPRGPKKENVNALQAALARANVTASKAKDNRTESSAEPQASAKKSKDFDTDAKSTQKSTDIKSENTNQVKDIKTTSTGDDFKKDKTTGKNTSPNNPIKSNPITQQAPFEAPKKSRTEQSGSSYQKNEAINHRARQDLTIDPEETKSKPYEETIFSKLADSVPAGQVSIRELRDLLKLDESDISSDTSV